MTTYAYFRLFEGETRTNKNNQFAACTCYTTINRWFYDDEANNKMNPFPYFRDYLYSVVKHGDTIVVPSFNRLGTNFWNVIYFLDLLFRTMEKEDSRISIRMIANPEWNTDLQSYDQLRCQVHTIIETQKFFSSLREAKRVSELAPKQKVRESISEEPIKVEKTKRWSKTKELIEDIVIEPLDDETEEGILTYTQAEKLCRSRRRKIYEYSPEKRREFLTEIHEYHHQIDTSGVKCWSIKQIADDYDLSASTVAHWLRTYTTKEYINSIGFDALCNRQMKRIMDHERDNKRRQNSQYSIKIPPDRRSPSKKKKDERIEQVVKLYKEGMSASDITKSLNISLTTVYRDLQSIKGGTDENK